MSVEDLLVRRTMRIPAMMNIKETNETDLNSSGCPDCCVGFGLSGLEIAKARDSRTVGLC